MSNLVKLIIIGALIIAVPVTVKLVQQQQILKSKAASDPACFGPVADNPPCARRVPDQLPCDSYVWKVDPNRACSTKEDCPKNEDQSSAVNPETSRWCYEFATGTNRCLQLRRKENSPDCSGGGGSTGGNCSATIEEARRQLVKAGGPFQNSSCDEVKNAVCSNCGVFVPPNATRTALCPGTCGGAAGGGGGGGSGGGSSTRPDLCQSTTANKTTLNQGDSITISSTANTAVKKFMFAFFNNDNNQDGSPKLISFGGQSYTPTVELPTAQTQTSKTFNFTDLSRSDDNWGGKIPQRIQVNGYFFDSQNNQSLPKPACVANFTLAAVSTPSPSPSPSPPPNRKPGDADDNRCVNVDDYTIWKQEAGVGGTKKCANWTSENPAIVDTEDYGIWYRAWKVITNREGCITPAAGSRCIDK